mmetsp:Transcript_42141/g.96602  ORF Transcript_42141/g.96602 Transcript_42141/m.96602 type:complete len:138 (-) Transcript_42141:1222-1635(-)
MSIACSRIIDPGVAKAFEHSCIPIQAKRSCDEEEEWRRWHENALATVSGEVQRLQTHMFNEISRLHAKLDYVAQLLTAAAPQVVPWQPSPQVELMRSTCTQTLPEQKLNECFIEVRSDSQIHIRTIYISISGQLCFR